jgi:hypothetical protein
MSVNTILGVYKFKRCTRVCINPLFAETSRFILQAIWMVRSLNAVFISHIALVFLHGASHGMHECEKTSTLAHFCPHFNPLHYNPNLVVLWIFFDVIFLFFTYKLVEPSKKMLKLEVSGVRGANSEASPYALFPFRPFSFRPFLISPWKWIARWNPHEPKHNYWNVRTCTFLHVSVPQIEMAILSKTTYQFLHDLDLWPRNWLVHERTTTAKNMGITQPLSSYERGMPGGSYQTKPGLPSGCQVNIKCFYAKSTCLGSNYRNINSLTLAMPGTEGHSRVFAEDCG